MEVHSSSIEEVEFGRALAALAANNANQGKGPNAGNDQYPPTEGKEKVCRILTSIFERQTGEDDCQLRKS